MALCLASALCSAIGPLSAQQPSSDAATDLLNTTAVHPRQAERALARSMMDNPRNPLLEVVTSEGDLYLELFQDAAPRNTALLLELVQMEREQPAAEPITTRAPQGRFAPRPALVEMPPQEPVYYYDGMRITRLGPDLFIEFGDPETRGEMHGQAPNETAGSAPGEPFGEPFGESSGSRRPVVSVPDEINARGLGLEQQRLLDAQGRPHPWLNLADEADFQRKVLAPLYRTMNIGSSAQLETQQDAVMTRLQQMNLMQVYENMGYRYSGQLASRRPVSGSVLMANHGPGSNNGDIIITLTDTPWLTGTHTVVGQLVSGQSISRLISRQPPGAVQIQQLRYVEELP